MGWRGGSSGPRTCLGVGLVDPQKRGRGLGIDAPASLAQGRASLQASSQGLGGGGRLAIIVV
jgi:hypothetical protein